jgi:hypothetical protein
MLKTYEFQKTTSCCYDSGHPQKNGGFFYLVLILTQLTHAFMTVMEDPKVTKLQIEIREREREREREILWWDVLTMDFP